MPSYPWTLQNVVIPSPTWKTRRTTQQAVPIEAGEARVFGRNSRGPEGAVRIRLLAQHQHQ